MIFIDSNVPMYLIGTAHPNKDRTVAVLTRLAQSGEALVTDIEVYQEILHRYAAIGRLDAIEPAFASLDALVDDVLAFGVAATVSAGVAQGEDRAERLCAPASTALRWPSSPDCRRNRPTESCRPRLV